MCEIGRGRETQRETLCEREREKERRGMYKKVGDKWSTAHLSHPQSYPKYTNNAGLTIDIVQLAPIMVNIYAALMALKEVDN